MRHVIFGLVAVAYAGAAVAQAPNDTPTTAVPPAGASHHSVSSNTTPRTPSGTDPAASKEGYAHNTGNVANGPTPPRHTGTQPPSASRSGPASATVVPGPAYGNGTANVGNSSENNGVAGAQGAAASATMQSGHTTNR